MCHCAPGFKIPGIATGTLRVAIGLRPARPAEACTPQSVPGQAPTARRPSELLRLSYIVMIHFKILNTFT